MVKLSPVPAVAAVAPEAKLEGAAAAVVVVAVDVVPNEKEEPAAVLAAAAGAPKPLKVGAAVELVVAAAGAPKDNAGVVNAGAAGVLAAEGWPKENPPPVPAAKPVPAAVVVGVPKEKAGAAVEPVLAPPKEKDMTPWDAASQKHNQKEGN